MCDLDADERAAIAVAVRLACGGVTICRPALASATVALHSGIAGRCREQHRVSDQVHLPQGGQRSSADYGLRACSTFARTSSLGMPTGIATASSTTFRRSGVSAARSESALASTTTPGGTAAPGLYEVA